MDLAESVTVPDRRLVGPMAMRVVVLVLVIMLMIMHVIVRVGICPAVAIAGFAHGERNKITLRPQHP